MSDCTSIIYILLKALTKAPPTRALPTLHARHMQANGETVVLARTGNSTTTATQSTATPHSSCLSQSVTSFPTRGKDGVGVSGWVPDTASLTLLPGTLPCL
ncbi:hypothetical protein Pmani_013538 [Petrolisthes manimaculis]|uniref:Uncharacterized protein n=1 Tax=Petrolisthes manimaculis TaxID=1843537 RepID=A0AAE1PYD5_9EUCA|nr:hypothetical protein Pmani_013538 [Petrolisthes manimaculis]